MRLTVLGCAGSFANAGSAASGYLVEHGGHRLVLDLGSGSFGRLQAHADPDTVDALLLSHLHPDHCADLVGLYVHRKYRWEGPAPALPTYGPSGTLRRADEMYGLHAPASMSEVLDVREHSEQYEIGPFTVRTARVPHPVTAYATRVEAGGRALVFSGDTGPSERLVELSRGADLALFEASFLDDPRNPPDLHLSAREAAEHADRAGVPRLVLTHLVAWNDSALSREQAAQAYDGELQLAEADATYEV